MKKTVILSLVICLLSNAFTAYGLAGMIVKSGTLSSSETWSGQVKVSGDVTVPKGAVLDIRAGTVLLYDKNNGTEDKPPNIIVYGTLKIGGASSENTSYQLIPVDSRTRVIEVTPYEVDTKILRDEFDAFKTQYAIIWTLLGGALIYAVSHR